MKQLALISLFAVVSLMACPPTGVVCKPGTLPCGTGCIDPNSDRRHCGACGNACGPQQDCNSASCECRAGTTKCSDGTCVATDFDPKNCGQCGAACASGEVCETGTCKASCTPGLLRCLASCVDAATDESHCGGCDIACAQGQQCRGGVCDYEAVAACYWSGQVVGFDPTTGVKGPLSDLGSNPATLARLGTTVLCADGNDRRLYSAAPSASGEYQKVNLASQTGAVPNQVLVDRPFVYVINAGSGTMTVLREGVDAGVVRLAAGVEGTLVLGVVAEVALGMNTFPQGLAKVDSQLWVPLFGGFGAEAADAGQALAKIDITNPAAPTLAGRVSLKNIDLKAFDGGTPTVARPWSIVAKNGALYVALSNLNPDTYVPEGPGLLARVDAVSEAVTVIDLGAADCLNPQWVSLVGSSVTVSCGGLIAYKPNMAVETISAAGVVALDALDQKLPAWSAAGFCPADGGTCLPLFPGRFAVSGQQVLLADQNGGRVVVLEVNDAGVREVRGGAAALSVCPVSPASGVANVADVLAR
jgi:hypothetical protein